MELISAILGILSLSFWKRAINPSMLVSRTWNTRWRTITQLIVIVVTHFHLHPQFIVIHEHLSKQNKENALCHSSLYTSLCDMSLMCIPLSRVLILGCRGWQRFLKCFFPLVNYAIFILLSFACFPALILENIAFSDCTEKSHFDVSFSDETRPS